MPHSKSFYSAVALFASLTGLMFAWGVLSPVYTLFGWRLARAGIAAVFVCGALQAIERLFRSENTVTRSSALASPARRNLRLVRNAAMGIFLIGLLASLVLRVFGDEYSRDVVTDLQLFSTAILFLGFCAADLLGERFIPGR